MATEAAPSGAERTIGALAYVGPFVLVTILRRKKSRFLLYHARQGLYLFAIAIAFLAITLGLLYVFQRPLKATVVFLILSVVLLLELIVYAITMLGLVIAAARGRMPMLPVLGDLAGER